MIENCVPAGANACSGGMHARAAEQFRRPADVTQPWASPCRREVRSPGGFCGTRNTRGEEVALARYLIITVYVLLLRTTAGDCHERN